MGHSSFLCPIVLGLVFLYYKPSPSEKKRTTQKEKQPYRIIKTDPAFWQIGDSVMVSIEAVYNFEKWIPSLVELFLPLPEPSLIDTNNLILLWIPDETLLEMNPPLALVTDGFLNISNEFEIMREVEFHAIPDSNGKYHFERQEPTSVIDTFFYEKYKDE